MRLSKEELRERIETILADAPVLWFEIVYGLLIGLIK